MWRGVGFAVVSSLIAVAAFAADASAQGQRPAKAAEARSSMEPTAGTYRRGKPQVRSYVQRRGGYSYSPADAINTYGDSRSKYGGASFYRDPSLDRQTNFGPFDHGFFFDSGIAPRGGNSPYPN